MNKRSIFSFTAIAVVAAFMTSDALAEGTDLGAIRAGLYHLDGISEDVARGDITECVGASTDALSSYSKSAASNQYGLVGSIVGDLLGAAKTNRMRNASLQKCMTLRGYSLFLVDEVTWQKLLGLTDTLRLKSGRDQSAAIDALAEFATKPLPNYPPFRS